MDQMPLDETVFTDEATPAVLDAKPGSSFPSRPRLSSEVLRYRGMVMNTITGAVLVHGRPARLAQRERELLATLMRRAGQIVTPMWLATQLRISAAEVEAIASALTSALREAGATCLPRHVEGVGYVLWR